MNAEELAARLTGHGHEITPSRVQKLAKHITSLAQLDATLAYLTPEDAALVRSEIAPYLRRLL